MGSNIKTETSISFKHLHIELLSRRSKNHHPLKKTLRFYRVFINMAKEPVIISTFQCQARPNVTGTVPVSVGFSQKCKHEYNMKPEQIK